MVDLNFAKDFEKISKSLDTVGENADPPRYWYSTGNYVLNKSLSGNFYNGCGQGRITGFVGPSGSGKSFLIANVVKSAQDSGAICLVLDSENALDNKFMGDIGVNVTDNYIYRSVTTVTDVNKLVSSFLSGYEKEYGKDNSSAPPVLIAIDSIAMLETDTENENFDKGIVKGDQGQKSKQVKQMLKLFVNKIKRLNVVMVVTDQVYQANMDATKSGMSDGNWVVSNALKYSLSQLVLLTKSKMRDKIKVTTIHGILMKCNTIKTRFTKPFQTVTIEVPYDTGMDPYSGLLDAMVAVNIVSNKGAWYYIEGSDVKFQRSKFSEVANDLLTVLASKDNLILSIDDTEDVSD